jgi:segregation and condensation protein A
LDLELDAYKGPLDLLLHLIKKMEIDIYDIPISQITRQYMNYIEAMQVLELEIAGEYIVMASTLMAIKSQMLLPIETFEVEDLEDELALDPRQALVDQLLEYRKYKYAAHLLTQKEEERKLYFSKDPMNTQEYKEVEIELPQSQYNTVDLFLAFHQMLQKRKESQIQETLIEAQGVSVEEKMDTIVAWLHSKKETKEGVQFEELFELRHSKNEIIVTFMALLELIKKKQIRIEQEDNYAPIFIFDATIITQGEKVYA